eukprot:10344394-Lingulodinium_polyedra.AAC.1
MGTIAGPKGLRLMARRQACRCDCGTNWVLSEHRHSWRTMRGASAQPGPSMLLPMASMTCWGRPERIVS